MHVRKTARDTYFPSRSDDAFFTARGDVTFASTAAAHAFAERVNTRDGLQGAARLRPAELAAMALVHEVSHAVLEVYRERHPGAWRELVRSLDARVASGLRAALIGFVRAMPPPAVYEYLQTEATPSPSTMAHATSPDAFVATGEDVVERCIDEVLLLWIVNQNPAYEPVSALVNDHDLGERYRAMVDETRRFLARSAPIGPHGENVVDVLLEPSRRSPRSIFDQLAFIERVWGKAYGLDRLPVFRRLLWARDLWNEENVAFERRISGFGPPPLDALRFTTTDAEPEPKRFSPDMEWMPSVVLIAKTVYVWLDQLSKAYGRPIERLDQIPNEELDRLARWGFTGLWLIGLFERSSASKKIKQMRGSTDAVASAYSLASYDIARELGGYAAYENLKHRAWQRGIRLAADMVPNHVGIDGAWVMDHPDWFVQTSTPPFPNYRFDGPDLSDDPRAGIFIENGYWNQSDAAVVFRRHDRNSGQDRFIYHGNDGTSIPWNDTAQLDYTKPEVRHAVIQTILHVARMFPIIRFDAAMTLAKRHYQRLWFPLPGAGGAIPSRADHAMTQEQFDAAIPVEFWREVVDTVAKEAPDTLLLAEAFWMMEGYFVRSLGMHRVYNSAFMNMLKREENRKYRETIRNVLDFEPEILKRFVNFMNNPDEETATAQFGDDDKYFGVCVLMATMPGLPMFGHGQIEGFHEKYGMEYRHAKWSEPPNEGLIARHEREIFPILEKRYVFSEVRNFEWYDFVDEGGNVDEDVYAYSNRAGTESALVLYNNKFKRTRGSLYESVPVRKDDGHVSGCRVVDALDVRGEGEWVRFRDMAKGLEYLRARSEIANAFSWELDAFKYHVFVDFHAVRATRQEPWDDLARELGHRGVPSLDRALREKKQRPIHEPLREALSRAHVDYLLDAWDEATRAPTKEGLEALDEKLGNVADGLLYVRARDDLGFSDEASSESFEAAKKAAFAKARERYTTLLTCVHATSDGARDEARKEARYLVDDDANPVDARLLLRWIELEAVASLLATTSGKTESAGDEHGAHLKTWELAMPLLDGFTSEERRDEAEVHTALVLAAMLEPAASLRASMARALDDEDGKALLGVHEADGVSWLNKERFEALANMLAEREFVDGRASLSFAHRLAEDVARIAEREGYKTASIARELTARSNTPLTPEP